MDKKNNFDELEKQKYVENVSLGLALTEKEYEMAEKKIKVCDEDLSSHFNCNTCWDFAHEPINCTNCEFVSCKSCFEKFRIINGKN